MTRALILAAGRGSRMKQLTEDKPKCFTVFSGKPLIDWQLNALRKAGIGDIGLVRGYLAESFHHELHYFDNHDWESSNMVRSLLCASRWMALGSVVSYSDIVYSANAVRQLLAGNGDIAITYDPHWLDLWKLRFEEVLSDAETFVINGESRVTEIGQTPQSIHDIQGQYMGLSYFSPTGWQRCLDILDRYDARFIDRLDMTKLLQLLIAADVPVQAVPVTNRWYEIDSEADLSAYESHLADSVDIFAR